MAKVGLKDTLALIAKGYSKKEIDALAAIDEEQEAPEKDEAPSATPAPVEDKKAPEDAAAKESIQEPDYKSMYEELLEKILKSGGRVRLCMMDPSVFKSGMCKSLIEEKKGRSWIAI